jgi:ABC-type lipopolysaccharide export system ATPase subunit
MIVGLVKPNSGNIFLDITDYPCTKERNREWILSKKLVFRKLSIEDNKRTHGKKIIESRARS